VADLSIIDGAVRKVILSIIESMAVLPNRFLTKIDVNNDYFQTHLYPLGLLRVTVERAYGFAHEAKSSARKFLSKITRASPDCYVKVAIGAEPEWKTTVKANTTSPVWNETHDLVVTDFDQALRLDVMDQDIGSDEEVGLAVTMIKDILHAGGKQELTLVKKGQETEGKVSVACQYFHFVPDVSAFSSSDHKGTGRYCGVATILVAGAFGIKGQRHELKPSVVVTWGKKHHFQTAILSDAPGMDIMNPAFDTPFRIPVTTDMVGDGAEHFRIALMNEKKEMGAVEVPLADVLKAPDMILQDKFDVGGGTTVRASICLRGVKVAEDMRTVLPVRVQK
jgi:Ca2+-dependent lipid-binding protein